MENPDNKKELDKIPDVDKNGDPIYKIDQEDPSEKLTEEEEVIPSIADIENEPQGNLQDIKDTTTEE